MKGISVGIVLVALSWKVAVGQSGPNLPALKGLATVTTLSQTKKGRAALQANYDVTGSIQNGSVRLPTLLTFPEQQQQALRDATSTARNLEQLADGLGSTLGAAYVARAHNNAQGVPLNLSPTAGRLIAYAVSLNGRDSERGKFLFANLTVDGKQPVAANLRAILQEKHGETDPFGRAYHLSAGSANANPFGDSRPFQTEKNMLSFSGRGYTNRPATSESYQRGPAMDLTRSPSYPSGHTTYGYTGAILLGLMVPDRYPEMIARGAEYGTSRILVGAHYAMDVLGGRTLALYGMAHLLANDPGYMDKQLNRPGPSQTPSVYDFHADLMTARNEVGAVLASNCGDTVHACARLDNGRFNDPEANGRAYNATQTYSLPVVYINTEQKREDVSLIAPEAGYLLTSAYPSLSLSQADDLLTETEGPGGGFLDDGSSFGVYSRLNLYEAALRARAMDARNRESMQ